MIDRQKFKDSFQYYDKEAILTIIDLFEKGLPERFEKINKNIVENDFDALAFNSHSLKSVTALFMDSEQAALLIKMEEMALSKKNSGLQELYNKVKSSTEELLKDLNVIRLEMVSENKK
jgi:HPt (histidine-containing phosphotransfer) domain-containing protein